MELAATDLVHACSFLKQAMMEALLDDQDGMVNEYAYASSRDSLPPILLGFLFSWLVLGFRIMLNKIKSLTLYTTRPLLVKYNDFFCLLSRKRVYDYIYILYIEREFPRPLCKRSQTQLF